MVFVALFMKNRYLNIVGDEHPVFALPETKQLYEYILKEYNDYVQKDRPSDTYNHPSNVAKLYAHTLDYRWQYALMTAINDFINVKSGREQESTKENWMAYLDQTVKVFREYVDNNTIESLINKTAEFWAFMPVKEEVVFVAKLMKNIYQEQVNVVNTSFALFGLPKTTILFNMISQFYKNEVVVDRKQLDPSQLEEFLKYSLDYRWQWAVMKTINRDSQSREDRFKTKTWIAWRDYLKTAYTYANRVPDEFQKFSKYEKEMVFVAKFMEIKIKNLNFTMPNYYEAVNGIKEILKIYDMLYHLYYWDLLWEKPRPTIDNHTLQYTWQYALMKSIKVLSLDPENQQEFWFSILQQAYQIAHASATPTPPAKAGGPGPAGAKQGPTAPGKAAEPVVQAPPAVDESPIQENEEFQKFKPCKKEMIFVAGLMKRIHSQAVHVDNTAFALFGLSKTNLLYNMIIHLCVNDIEENPTAKKELYTHPLDYRWQWAVMTTINFIVQSEKEGFDKWIAYLQASYKYVNNIRDDFQTFRPYEKQMVFVAEYMKRMLTNIQKPKDDDPVSKLTETKQLSDWIKTNKKSLLEPKQIRAFSNEILDYTWQYALMLAMIEFIRISQGSTISWIAYLENAYKLSHTAVTPTAPVNAEPSVSGSGNGGPNPPGDGGGPPSGEQSDSATSGSAQSSRSNRTVKETEGAEKARTDRLRVPVIQTGKTRDEQLKKLREIGETGGVAENDAGQTTTSTPATSEPSTPRSGAAGGGAGGKLVEGKTPRSKPYDKKTESGNEAPAAQVEVPKLPLPEREDNPPASEVSDEDVKSDEEPSDSEGGGQEIETTPSTPADTFQPETTPPPDQKPGGGRPQSAPLTRKVKETGGAEEARASRLRGAVTQRDEKRKEIMNVIRKESAEAAATLDLPLRDVKITKAQPTITSDFAVAVVQPNIDVESVAGADGPAAQKTPRESRVLKSAQQRTKLYTAAPFWRKYKTKIKSVADRVSQLLHLTKDELENKLKRMDVLYAVMCMYFHDCFHNPVYKKYLEDNFIEPSVRCEFMLLNLMDGATNKKASGDETLDWIDRDEWESFLQQYEEIKPSEQITLDRINNAVEKKIAWKVQTEVHNKETREEQAIGEGKRTKTMRPTQKDSRRQLYLTKDYSQWFDLKTHITTLAAYIKTQLNVTDRRGENPKLKESKPLYVVYNYVSLLMDKDLSDENLLDAEVQNEKYVMDAMNNDVNTINNKTAGFEDCVTFDTWKEFLQRIPTNVTDIKELKKMTLRSELVITDANPELKIDDLVRRLKILHDW
jgi:hypothetical protein